jgi:hypothetical protein
LNFKKIAKTVPAKIALQLIPADMENKEKALEDKK